MQHHFVPVQTAAQQASLLNSQAVFNGFIQPSVLTEQLNQFHVHMSVSWPRCQLGLEEVEQPVPSLLTLTTQQTFLHREEQIDQRVTVASIPPLINIHLLLPSLVNITKFNVRQSEGHGSCWLNMGLTFRLKTAGFPGSSLAALSTQNSALLSHSSLLTSNSATFRTRSLWAGFKSTDRCIQTKKCRHTSVRQVIYPKCCSKNNTKKIKDE